MADLQDPPRFPGACGQVTPQVGRCPLPAPACMHLGANPCCLQELCAAAQQQQAALQLLMQQPWVFLSHQAGLAQGCAPVAAVDQGPGSDSAATEQLLDQQFLEPDLDEDDAWQLHEQQQQQQPVTLFRPKAQRAEAKAQEQPLLQALSGGSDRSTQSALTGMGQSLLQPVWSPSVQL